MKIIRTAIWISLAAGLAGGLSNICLADGPNLVTIDRLQAAYRAETIAQARYLAFAVKADDEGYKQVASLFRTVARSEQILYTFHYDAIKEMGGVPADVTADPPTVATTKENLEFASNKEAADQLNADYSTYIKTARAEGSRTAAKVLEYARIVEAQNFRLFAAAVKSLESMKNGPRAYYICGVNGLVSPTLDVASCSGPDWEKVK
ncbi:MAG TPA: rubrerythrin family protein [Bryobacteraceae bacterium]|nr:rubrerythrin family protein [Bryobacteraceae bacterium]